MRTAPRPGLLLVAAREWRWMRRDRLVLFLAIGIPVIAFAVLSLTFGNGVIRNLPVTVVDADRTPTSEIYVQALAAAPAALVANRATNLNAAMHAVFTGESIAAVYIPPNFEHDLIARKRPQIVVLYNSQFLTPGNNAANALTAASTAATQLLVERSKRGFGLGPLVVEQYVLSNPALNYVQFLLRAVLPTVLHVVIAITAGYTFGSEWTRRSRAAWLRVAGGSAFAAIAGKMLPYFIIFFVLIAVDSLILHGIFDIPFRGDVLMVAIASALMIIAYLAVGAMFQLLSGSMALGLSFVGIFCSPSFGFAGVGFPVFGMHGFARAWGDMLPLRWYIQVLFDQALRGLPPSSSARSFAILAALTLVYFAVCWLSLRFRRLPARAVETVVEPALAPPASVWEAMTFELRRLLANKSALSLIVIGPILYGALYPQPYLGQLLRNIPIAVVDQDRTELSRQLIETLNADENLQVAVRGNTVADAERALRQGRVFAIVVIPNGTERNVFKGDTASIGTYVDSAYFLLYSRLSQGIREAVGVTQQDLATRGARRNGSLAYAALIKSAPAELVTEPLFNPTGGYASYVVPAAFVLIIQQTLLIGVASLGGTAFAQGGHRGRSFRAGSRAVIGQAFAHVVLVLPGLLLYLIILPRFYGFSALGSVLDLALMALPFALSVSLLAQFVGAWFRRSETAVMVIIATSLPLFFLVGVSWPLEAIPPALRAISQIFPSTSAIDGLVRLNQMGAPLQDVRHDWIALWGLTLLYGCLAALATIATSRRAGNER